MTSRYAFDAGACSLKNGFAQVDTSQDACYFGLWANPETFTVISYCEGDITKQQAATAEEFVEEIRKIKAWHEETGLKFLGIDAWPNKTLEQRFVDLGLGDLLH